MGDLAVAIPAKSLTLAIRMVDHLFNRFPMTPPTIPFHHRHRAVGKANDLRFQPGRENGRMVQSVSRFERIGAENMMVGHVTVVAGSHPGMARTPPGSIMRAHHVTVHACFRVIAQIRSCPRHMGHDQPQPESHPKNEKTRTPPPRRNRPQCRQIGKPGHDANGHDTPNAVEDQSREV